MVATMSDEDIPMAQCGACNSIIPLTVSLALSVM